MWGRNGIALATTFQARSTQAHQAILSAHMTPLNPPITRDFRHGKKLDRSRVSAAKAALWRRVFVSAMVAQAACSATWTISGSWP